LSLLFFHRFFFFGLFWNLFLIAMKFNKLDHLVQGLFMNLVVGLRNVVKTRNVHISLQEITSLKVVQLDCLSILTKILVYFTKRFSC
jgi:hypothetical protein